jgi:uncharacterized protein (DUF736 family)
MKGQKVSIIGHVKKDDDGKYSGRLKTLSVNVPIEIEPVADKQSEKHPDYRITVMQKEVGAGWTRVGEKSKNDYISCKVEDPDIGLLYFNLGSDASQDDPDVFALYWNAPKKKKGLNA